MGTLKQNRLAYEYESRFQIKNKLVNRIVFLRNGT